jgi:hypothetical protein
VPVIWKAIPQSTTRQETARSTWLRHRTARDGASPREAEWMTGSPVRKGKRVGGRDGWAVAGGGALSCGLYVRGKPLVRRPYSSESRLPNRGPRPSDPRAKHAWATCSEATCRTHLLLLLRSLLRGGREAGRQAAMAAPSCLGLGNRRRRNVLEAAGMGGWSSTTTTLHR